MQPYDFAANLSSMPDGETYGYHAVEDNYPWAANAEGDATTSVEPAAFPDVDIAAIAEPQPVWGMHSTAHSRDPLIQPSPDPSAPVFELGAPVIDTVTSIPGGNPSLPVSPDTADATTSPGQATATGGRRTVPCPKCDRG